MNIQLREFADSDIPIFVEWLSRPHVQQWYAPVQEWIDEVHKRTTEYNWIRHFIILADAEPIGFCQYYPYWRSGETWNGSVPTEGTYSIDYLIGNVEYLRRGCTGKALDLLKALVFSMPDGKRIIAQPEQDNIASQRTLLTAGFQYDKINKLYSLSARASTKRGQKNA